ncbi:MAG: hypothetical protein KDM91_11975 [Verrucomicrobiae bacterium]|nr:hypothetical protein [Verrucomicrobiae bacterium]MCP5541893.1 hypothetical protein [Akkermansiaceae bacterium]
MTAALKEKTRDWNRVSEFLFVPHTEADCDRLASFLDDLIDEVGEDEGHPLASLMEVVGALIQTYEDRNIPELA